MGNQVSVAFEEAAGRVQHLKTTPTEEQKLKLYALYKQATSGDNYRPEPTDILAFKEKKKWKAWEELRGVPCAEAEEQYIALVQELEKA
ncbi:hypothetical protein DFQ27_002194 [Actinomortierella ambigua]|uniref:ACB domain-containing protein n=1 Tax=Actinomortierella ambigua TaxID=1343610 RepID=A0A9P6UCY4_9FUNG|nr:hypothetical protein DFQ26_004846 [Actinomortierella ambigua]KAG0269778.1 hypothetical protein DFQ27_002194 [Actinomortierella ambigua]